jgi:GH15 family glucan-1,4-alpha-glucosidase
MTDAAHTLKVSSAPSREQLNSNDMGYKPISDYGIVGDLRTAALIGCDGSVDWLCLPRFDSPTVFAALLDSHRGGFFKISPSGNIAHSVQLYHPDTNILVTRFLADGAVVELTDFMPLQESRSTKESSWLVRRVKAVSGSAQVTLRCAPAFDYARGKTEKVELERNGALFHSADVSLHLATTVELKVQGSVVVADFTLRESQTVSFILSERRGQEWEPSRVSERSIDHLESATASYWRRWLSKCTYQGRWRELVHRSALLLQLLSYAPTGAIVAAPTCSLPEWIGGDRNWDYRYNWIRDAGYTIYALERIGLFDEAEYFMKWIEDRIGEIVSGSGLQTVYAVDGSRELKETILELEGYRGSRPVRVGNAAFEQLQLDIYGALIDAVYLYNKYARPITGALWRDVCRLVNWVCDNWQRDDQGIWELRGDPRPLVHSKVMCWVAIDRGLRLARKRSLPADEDKWLRNRNQIYEQVVNKGWNARRKSFVQSYGSDELDASILMMPLVFFMAPNDPMMVSTVDAIMRPVSQGGLFCDGMVYRYARSTDDGLQSREGTFNVCTLWLIEALARMGRVQEAHWLFEKMLSRTSHLSLFSEQMSTSGEQLGNFPQGLTHMGLISAAYNLSRRLDPVTDASS